jgi:TonB family protein
VTRLVNRVDPDFPREASSAGIEEGIVKARMTLDASGSVARVEIVEARPRRVFDRAVIRALSQWRYNEGAAGRTVDMEIAFKSR